MEFLTQIIVLIVGFFNFVLVLRAWFQFCRVDIHQPASQTLLRLTSPIVNPLSRVLPTVKGICFAAILPAGLIVSLQHLLFGAPLSIALLIGGLSLLKAFGQILFFSTLIRALMSWVTQGSHPLDLLVYQITEPVLGLLRKILPRTGMLDFSVMILGFILLLLNNALYQWFGRLWEIA